MITVISPAKSLDFEMETKIKIVTLPNFKQESETLIKVLKKKKPEEIASLMSISDKLADLNYERFQSWKYPTKGGTSKPALFAFQGDVYQGLEAKSFSKDNIAFAQNHLRILSGLHGLLRPLDLINPYRLEMGTKLTVNGSKNLYQFWGEKVRKELEEELAQTTSKTLINLASNEYFKVVQAKKLGYNVISPVFKERKGDAYKVVSFYAKKARGQMVAFIIKNKIDSPDAITAFNENGYTYNEALSKPNEPMFTRG